MKIRYSRVLVTGGAGFIGSHLVDQLAQDGIEVGVFDSLKAGSWTNTAQVKNVHFHKGDVADPEYVVKVVRDYDVVIHHAALISNAPSATISEIYRSNVTGTINLLEAAVDSDVQRFVYASSAAVYGETVALPAREDSVPNPLTPYGFSKLEGEKYCQFFSEAHGLRTVSLRYFNVYGPRQKPGQYSGVISAFIDCLSKGEPPIIFGDGSQTRDFVHVSDVVRANMLVLTNNPPPGEVFNISTAKPTSINQLAIYLCKLTGRENLNPRFLPPRPGDIKHSYGDFAKAKASFDFEPRVTFEEGLRKLVTQPKMRGTPRFSPNTS